MIKYGKGIIKILIVDTIVISLVWVDIFISQNL